jgi:CMP-N,N'-diacetyllegionaminic acid synthase
MCVPVRVRPGAPTMNKLTYIVDIDRTILDTINGDYHYAKAIPDRIAAINKLHREGHKVIYWTARGAISGKDWTEFTRKQLSHFGCEYTELWCNKPHYDVWIDDKAINSEDYFKGPSHSL